MIVVEVHRDGWTGNIQVSISELDDEGGGHGYRILGPKFNGSGELLAKKVLDQRDAKEIEAYLIKVAP